jgi:hypothetical protein
LKAGYEAKIKTAMQNLEETKSRQRELERQIQKLLKLTGELEIVKESSPKSVKQTIGRIYVFEDKHIEVEFSFKNEFTAIDRICADE